MCPMSDRTLRVGVAPRRTVGQVQAAAVQLRALLDSLGKQWRVPCQPLEPAIRPLTPTNTTGSPNRWPPASGRIMMLIRRQL